MEAQPMKFQYKDLTNDISIKWVLPHKVWFGQVEGYSQPQWFIEAYDFNKHKNIDFAMKNIVAYLD